MLDLSRMACIGENAKAAALAHAVAGYTGVCELFSAILGAGLRSVLREPKQSVGYNLPRFPAHRHSAHRRALPLAASSPFALPCRCRAASVEGQRDVFWGADPLSYAVLLVAGFALFCIIAGMELSRAVLQQYVVVLWAAMQGGW